MRISQLHSSNNGKELLFAPGKSEKSGQDNDRPKANADGKPWKVMIIDDDDVMHQVSLMVLADYEFEGLPVEIIQGYSGKACRQLLKKHPDTAVLLLDVVMETESAGLDAVKYIREELNNQALRIIIRTGQPGQAPEKEIANQYDINGYTEKSGLTAQNLFACITEGLRAYRDLNNIQ